MLRVHLQDVKPLIGKSAVTKKVMQKPVLQQGAEKVIPKKILPGLVILGNGMFAMSVSDPAKNKKNSEEIQEEIEEEMNQQALDGEDIVQDETEKTEESSEEE